MNPADGSGLRKTGIWLAAAGLFILIITFFFSSDDACFLRVGSTCVPDNDLYGLVIGMSVLTWAAVFFAAHTVVAVLRDRLNKSGAGSIREM
jgi:hypothetical protein